MRKPLVALFTSLFLLTACTSRKPHAAESGVFVPQSDNANVPEPALEQTTIAVASPTNSIIGLSRQGQSITAVTLGSGQTRVYLIGSIHGDEPEGRFALEPILNALIASTRGTTVRFVQDMNPDGSLAGTRTNSNGVDLNRNWPAANFSPAKSRGPAPLSEPETLAVHSDIQAFDPHLILVLHSARSGPFMNFDGPPTARDLCEQFVSAAKASGDARWRIVPDMGYPTPGSMGSYFGNDCGVPILTVELRRGDQPHSIPEPLIAGLNAVLSDRSVAFRPLSQSSPALAVQPDNTMGTNSGEPAR